MPVKLIDNYLADFISQSDIEGYSDAVRNIHNQIHNKTGEGSEFLGFVDLPYTLDEQIINDIKQTAEKIKNQCDVFIVIGIGGSYLGSKSAIDVLTSPLYNEFSNNKPKVYFAGNDLNPQHYAELFSICEGRDVALNVISKSGTTTEPAIAFRIFREYLEKRYGEEGASSRIYVTTDKEKGTLKKLADKNGYKTFVIPDDIGGRYSVLTPVGLLPMAVAGIDIKKVLVGAKQAHDDLLCDDIYKNDAYLYAVIRNVLYKKGKTIELLTCYDTSFATMAEWYKQLFAESEGKCKKGIFPASAMFSNELHSIGQFIQDGNRLLFETVIDIICPREDILITANDDDFDGLNYLANKTMSDINRNAMKGALLAHTSGGVPNIVLQLPEINEQEYGYLVYFFEKACAMSAYLLGVNPFDQPGVESYKNNMFVLLGKPRYEDKRQMLLGKLY